MISEHHSITWPNVVHRAILSELHGFINYKIIDRVVIYSTLQFDLSINIDPDGLITIGYAIEKEPPFRFHRYFCTIAPGDEINLHIFRTFIKDIQNHGRIERNHSEN